ncbi:MAG: helix-turn-helix domain-containing protein [Oscillospiraceae bacterium]
MSNDILYTVKEVSEIIHTNKAYVYSLIKSGLLPALKLGSFKIRKEALLQFLSENEGKDLTHPQEIIKIGIAKKTPNDCS